MLSIKNIADCYWCEDYSEYMEDEEYIDSVTHVVEVLEKDGLTVQQAQDVLNGANKAILFSKID